LESPEVRRRPRATRPAAKDPPGLAAARKIFNGMGHKLSLQQLQKESLQHYEQICWLDLFSAALDDAPYCIVLCDMNVPGLPLTFVNKEFERQTGFSKAEAEGQNCRLLQGPMTEQDQVAKIIRALQTASELELEITNCRKSGESFKNLFSLKPVRDTKGVYRYTIGVQYDMSTGSEGIAEMREMVQALPSCFDVDLQPDSSVAAQKENMSEQQQQEQLRESLRQFSKLAWLSEPVVAMNHIMEHSDAAAAFNEFLATEYMEEQLHLFLGGKDISHQNEEADMMLAKQLFQKFISPTGRKMPADSEVVQEVQEEAQKAGDALGSDSFPRFLQSPLVERVLDAVVGDGSKSALTRPELLWKKYRVPPDTAEWLYAFVGAAETFPACIVISDMSIPGNPMFFVNQEFSRITGYSKEEAQGRNCRFLQGPQTEPASVAVIQDTLRRGVDCHVRITNYRKNGEAFQNLLSMRPVHDSNSVYRYCIGVQFEVTKDGMLKERLKRLDSLLQQLPSTLNVGAAKKRRGRGHRKRPVRGTQGKATSELVSAAMVGTSAVEGTDITSSARFAENREVMLRELKAGAVPDAHGASQPPPRTVRFAQ